jgi:hypothetical protein
MDSLAAQLKQAYRQKVLQIPSRSLVILQTHRFGADYLCRWPYVPLGGILAPITHNHLS